MAEQKNDLNLKKRIEKILDVKTNGKDMIQFLADTLEEIDNKDVDLEKTKVKIQGVKVYTALLREVTQVALLGVKQDKNKISIEKLNL